ncbi:isocitrate lyase/PEP mutase family protein [Saccharomonospora piscinae]|uniref:isocitrate lyase/PEP mutase family protein n=1 Tax=Saccharomonospora piscinae TaxID=687388 RepID=UPI0004657B2E|nr:isocitrate lyase/phosphoenolpyruvate mutase family protein [Saccharomonospora piscinae]
MVEPSAAAQLLRALHVPGDPLVLPNVWDADTARLVVAAGFPVVATSSVALAHSLGHADGERAPAEAMFAAAARISAAVDVPVTVDAESGYGLPPRELATRLLETGAVGCNIEDTDPRRGARRPADEQAALLASLRDAVGDGFVLNARIDSFLDCDTDDQRAALSDATSRARCYLDAGADAVYPIHATDPQVIATLVRELDPAPVNVTMLPGGPGLTELAGLGVARISLGGGMWTVARNALTRFLGDLAAHEPVF